LSQKELDFFLFYFPNGRYIDCLSLIYAINKSKTLNVQSRSTS